jgi:hypothetical protein
MERWHHPKIIASLEADDALDPFWGDYSSYEYEPGMDIEKYVSDEMEARHPHAKVVNRGSRPSSTLIGRARKSRRRKMRPSKTSAPRSSALLAWQRWS